MQIARLLALVIQTTYHATLERSDSPHLFFTVTLAGFGVKVANGGDRGAGALESIIPGVSKAAA